ncbi:MAG: hypothetical protein KF734_14395 [Saprospiraceae bacterium]|nr:hypothetical protein [Saprospiraceae bacterium]
MGDPSLLADMEHTYLIGVSLLLILLLTIIAYFALRNPAIFDHFQELQSGGTVVINGEFNNAPDAVYSGGLVSLSGVFNNDGSVSTTLTVNSSGVFNNNAGATYTQGGIITVNGTLTPPRSQFHRQ